MSTRPSAVTLPLRAPAGPAALPAPPPRVVRAALGATRLTPGDRVLLAGPGAAAVEPVFELLGLRVETAEKADAALAARFARGPGAAAFEAAVWCGPDAAAVAFGKPVDPLVTLRPLVRPGRCAVALRRCENLADPAGPRDGVRFADRGKFGLKLGAGGWVLHTAPGSAVKRDSAGKPARRPLAAAA